MENEDLAAAKDFAAEADTATISEWKEAPGYIKALSFVVALLMFAMIALIFVDVVGRYGFGLPIPAGFEITEFVMATMIFSSIPIVSFYNSHITVGLFDNAFRGRVRRVQQTFVLLFTAGMTGFMGDRLLDQAQYMQSTELLGQQLDIQVAPVVYGMAFMSFVASLLMVMMTIKYLRTGIEPKVSGSLD